MSAYPPPNEVLPIFNPANYANVGNTGTEDIPFLSTYFLRFPTSQGSETIDGTLVGKEQITAEKNIVMAGTAGVNFLEFPDGTQQFTATGGGSILTSNNIFTGTNEFQNTLTGTTNVILSGTAGTNYLEFPDGTQQFTASAGGNPTNILSSNNTWTGNQNWNGVNRLTTGATTLAPADGDNGTAVPTTEWVNTAIKDALSNIQPSTNNSVNQTFTGAVISTVYSIPADADNFNIGLLGVGGYAGASATSVPISPGNTTNFTLYSGGQGGGSIGNGTTSIPNSGIGLAGQLLTLSCSGHGTGTNVQLSWTNSITGLPVVISVPNGGDGGNATSSSAGTGGAGALVSASVLPPVGRAWNTQTSPQAPSGSPGASFAFNSSTPLTAVPYAGLTPAYTSTQVAGSPYDEQFLPLDGTGSGSQGYGQIYQSFFTSADTIYRNSNATFFGYGASPIGTGQINVRWTVGDPKQLGGTNSSFIAYDDPDPLLKTKQIYTDKQGLVVSQDLTGSFKTTTLTPTNLTQDLNGVVSTALIADIITVANAGPIATPDLDAVLTAGSSAGANDIDMNTNNINNGGTFTATTFVGALTGNATSATTATNATNATDITITDSTATAGTFYPTFVNSAGTNKSVRIDTTGLTYSPSTDTLTTTNFAGTATHATDITITDTTATVGTFYPTFVNTAGTQKSVRVDTTGLTYSPSTDTLTTTNFAGTATTATNIAGGLGGSIPYQTAVNTTALLANGTAGQILQSNGTTLAPSWVSAGGGAGTLQQTLDLGNTATGANATIELTDTGVGGGSNPILTLNNTDTSAGSATIKMYKNINTNGSAIGELSFQANSTTSNNIEYARIAGTIRNNTTANLDGSISLQARVNNTLTEMVRVNGVDTQTEFFTPIDMNGQDIKTSSGNMTISTASSGGTGDMTASAKGAVNLTAVSGSTTAPVNSLVLSSGNTITLTNGNEFYGLPENIIEMTATPAGTNNQINMEVNNDNTSKYSQFFFGLQGSQFSICEGGTGGDGVNVWNIPANNTGNITLYRSLDFTFGSVMSGYVGVLEKSIINSTTSGTVDITGNRFNTTIFNPTVGGLAVNIITPTVVGYWWGICNKSITETIDIKLNGGTVITLSNSSSFGSTIRLGADTTTSLYII